jgi:GAF domain-containing protein
MKKPVKLPNEAERIDDLKSYHILDTMPEQEYDDITALASYICGTKVALISLVDSERQWFKSRVGIDATETSRDVSFCAHAIHDPEELFYVPDTLKDERFRDNPLVTGESNIRFYAGVPLVTAKGNALGTLCVIDDTAMTLTSEQENMLKRLSRQVVVLFEQRKQYKEYREIQERSHQERQIYTLLA